jgi:uncharacterized membrane protein
MLLGWGAFNVVEGLFDHQLLGIHHIRTGPHELAWDLGYLLMGAGLAAVGVIIERSVVRPASRVGQAPYVRGRRARPLNR